MYLSCLIYEIFGSDIIREIWIFFRELSGNFAWPMCGNPDFTKKMASKSEKVPILGNYLQEQGRVEKKG